MGSKGVLMRWTNQGQEVVLEDLSKSWLKACLAKAQVFKLMEAKEQVEVAEEQAAD